MRANIALWTHRGCVRSQNEDAVVIPGVVLRDSPLNPIAFDGELPAGSILAVLDGMGGHRGGRTASGLAADVLLGTYDDLAVAVADANRSIYAAMEANPNLARMGAACCAVHLGPDSVTIGNVGDARVYSFATMTMILTVDDRSTEGNNVLTQSLGGTASRTSVDPHLQRMAMSGPLRLMLCTDGLHDIVSFGAIDDILTAQAPIDAVRYLVNAALTGGAPDNVSVLVADLAPSVTTNPSDGGPTDETSSTPDSPGRTDLGTTKPPTLT